MWNVSDDRNIVDDPAASINATQRSNETAGATISEIYADNQTFVEHEFYDNSNVPPALSAYHGPVDADLVAAINPFWLQFAPPPPAAHIALGCLHTCIMTAGLLGNALVIFMFVRFRSLRTPANTLVINLAVSDFFMLAKAPFVIYNSFEYGPALGAMGCRLYGFVGGLTGVASICTLTAISIDRYFVVVHPLDPLRNISQLRSRLMVAVVWVYSAGFAVVPALDIGLSRYVPEGFLTSCSFDYLDRRPAARIFMFVFFVCAWALPFAIITYCYYHILRAVAAAKQIQCSRRPDVRKRTEIKLAGVVLAIIALWFAAWTPYSVVALLGISGQQRWLTPLASMVPAVFCKSAACLDPYVYAITHPRFQMEFRRMWRGRAGAAATTTTMDFGASTRSRMSRFSSVGGGGGCAGVTRSMSMSSSTAAVAAWRTSSVASAGGGGNDVTSTAAAAAGDNAEQVPPQTATATGGNRRLNRGGAEAPTVQQQQQQKRGGREIEVRVVSTISEEVSQIESSTSM